MTKPIILPDLMALAAAVIAPAEQVLETATSNLREMLSEGGRISAALLEENQAAAHGLSWLATYVESLRQMKAWADRLTDAGTFGETEQLLLQIAFGEYLAQMRGGIPMSQTEILRLLLDVAARSTVLFDRSHRNRPSARQFERDRSRTSKEIQRFQPFQIETRTQQIEQPLPAEIGGGAALEMTRRRKPAALEPSADHAHRINCMTGRKCCR